MHVQVVFIKREVFKVIWKQNKVFFLIFGNTKWRHKILEHFHINLLLTLLSKWEKIVNIFFLYNKKGTLYVVVEENYIS